LVFVLIIFSRPPLPTGGEPCGPAEVGCLDLWEFFGFYVAGRYFHTDGDFKMLSFLDLPAAVVADGVSSLLQVVGIGFSRVVETYVFAGLWFTLGSLQWWLIGAVIVGRRSNKRLRPTA
jgi:hypothetical protein